jgi:uncharacterized surface protein with fasciclin (FAS1) repeats
MTMLREDVIDIYRNRRTGEFRIQPFARAKLSSQAFGSQTVLQAGKAAESLLVAVLENLEKNNTQQYIKESAPRRSAEEFRRSLKEDQLVSVVRSQGKYRITPFKRMRNSMGSVDELEVLVSEKEFLERGTELIQEAFRQVL